MGMALVPCLVACDKLSGLGAQPTFHSTDITGATFARHLELPDASGKQRSLADW